MGKRETIIIVIICLAVACYFKGNLDQLELQAKTAQHQRDVDYCAKDGHSETYCAGL